MIEKSFYGDVQEEEEEKPLKNNNMACPCWDDQRRSETGWRTCLIPAPLCPASLSAALWFDRGERRLGVALKRPFYCGEGEVEKKEANVFFSRKIGMLNQESYLLVSLLRYMTYTLCDSYTFSFAECFCFEGNPI